MAIGPPPPAPRLRARSAHPDCIASHTHARCLSPRRDLPAGCLRPARRREPSYIMLNESRTRAGGGGIVGGVAGASSRLGSHGDPRGGGPLVCPRAVFSYPPPEGGATSSRSSTSGGATGSGATSGGATSGDATRGAATLSGGKRRCAHPLGPPGTPPDGLRLRAERPRTAAGRTQVARTPPAPRRTAPAPPALGAAAPPPRTPRLVGPLPIRLPAPALTAGRAALAALAPQVPRDDQARRHARRAARRQAGGRRACACVYSFLYRNLYSCATCAMLF